MERARELLAARPELVGMDMAGNDEHRAIHFAVLRRDPAMVRLLMQAGADARKGIFPHRDATSAFAIARDREYHEIVAIIAEEEQKRPEQTRQKEPRRPPAAVPPVPDEIADAISRGDEPKVRECVSADPGILRRTNWRTGGLLTLAVKHRQLEIVRLLLDLGADVDERTVLEELEEPTLSWGSPLWHAALAGDFEIARLLLDRGADPNGNVYASGWPLRNAWNHQDDSVKRLLLERGAKVQPYMVAESCDAAEARRLLDAGAPENAVHELVWSSAGHGCPEILELALPRLNWPRDDKRWHWVLIQPMRGVGEAEADTACHVACMQVLLRRGIDPNISRFGQRPLHYLAAREGGLTANARVLFASLLLDFGARMDVRDDLLESTPLGWACRWGRKELVELLIARGADVHESDAAPWAAPERWARKMQHGDVLGVLAHGRTSSI